MEYDIVWHGITGMPWVMRAFVITEKGERENDLDICASANARNRSPVVAISSVGYNCRH